jgi:hypothetical protein
VDCHGSRIRRHDGPHRVWNRFRIVYGLAFGSVFFLVGDAVGGVAHAKIKGSPVKADVQAADIQEADVQEAKATEVQAAELTVLEQSRIVDMTTSRC